MVQIDVDAAAVGGQVFAAPILRIPGAGGARGLLCDRPQLYVDELPVYGVYEQPRGRGRPSISASSARDAMAQVSMPGQPQHEVSKLDIGAAQFGQSGRRSFAHVGFLKPR